MPNVVIENLRLLAPFFAEPSRPHLGFQWPVTVLIHCQFVTRSVHR